jgi:hypothetical protein
MLPRQFYPYEFYPHGAVRIAQVDIRPEQLGRRAPINVGPVSIEVTRVLPRRVAAGR